MYTFFFRFSSDAYAFATYLRQYGFFSCSVLPIRSEAFCPYPFKVVLETTCPMSPKTWLWFSADPRVAEATFVQKS